MAEAERNLTPETPDRGRGDASGKRAVTSACDDAPGELRSWAAWAWLSLSEGMPSRHQAPSASRKAISARGGGECSAPHAFSRSLWRSPCPVCARHPVQEARLARRRLRLTPEVNTGYLPAVGATDIFLFPSAATARLHKTRCTACGTCTTGIAFNGGSESRLLMPVGRAPDVARGPRALRDDLPVCMCELALDVPSQNIWKSFL